MNLGNLKNLFLKPLSGVDDRAGEIWRDVKDSASNKNSKAPGPRVGALFDPLAYIGGDTYDDITTAIPDALNKGLGPINRAAHEIDPVTRTLRDKVPIFREVTDWTGQKPASAFGLIYGGITGGSALFGGAEAPVEPAAAEPYDWTQLSQYGSMGGSGGGQQQQPQQQGQYVAPYTPPVDSTFSAIPVYMMAQGGKVPDDGPMWDVQLPTIATRPVAQAQLRPTEDSLNTALDQAETNLLPALQQSFPDVAFERTMAPGRGGALPLAVEEMGDVSWDVQLPNNAGQAPQVEEPKEDQGFWGPMMRTIGKKFGVQGRGMEIGSLDQPSQDEAAQLEGMLRDAMRAEQLGDPKAPKLRADYDQVKARVDAKLVNNQGKIAQLVTQVKTINDEIAGIRPQGMGFWKSAAFDAGVSVGAMAPSLALGVGTGGGTALVLPLVGMQTYSESYASNRADGLDPQRASVLGGVDGVTEMVTELFPTAALLKRTGIFKKFLESTAKDIPGELVANWVQTTTAELAQLGNNPTDAQIKEAISRAAGDSMSLGSMANVAATTAIAGGALSGAARLAQGRARPAAAPAATVPPPPAAAGPIAPATPPVSGAAPAAQAAPVPPVAAAPAAPAGTAPAGSRVAMYAPADAKGRQTPVQVNSVAGDIATVTSLDEEGQPILVDDEPATYQVPVADLYGGGFNAGRRPGGAQGSVPAANAQPIAQPAGVTGPKPAVAQVPATVVAPAAAAPATNLTPPTAAQVPVEVKAVQDELADMKDPATPRQAVFIPKERVAELRKGKQEGVLAGLPKDANWDYKGGVMVFPTPEARDAALAAKQSIKKGPEAAQQRQQLTDQLLGTPAPAPVEKNISPPASVTPVAESTVTPAAVEQVPATDQSPAPAAADQVPAAPSNEGAGSATAAPGTAKPGRPKAVSIRDQLQQTIDHVKAQEAVPADKKLAGSLEDRMLTAVTLAGVVQQVAANKDLPSDTRAEARRAAAAVRGMENKTDEDVAKGKGVSHAKLTSKIQDLLDVAAKLVEAMPKNRAPAAPPKSVGAEATPARTGKKKVTGLKPAGKTAEQIAEEAEAQGAADATGKPVIGVTPRRIAGREMISLVKEMGLDPDQMQGKGAMSAAVKEFFSDFNESGSWLSYLAGLKQMFAERPSLQVKLRTLGNEFVTAKPDELTAVTDKVVEAFQDVDGARLDPKAVDAILKYMGALRAFRQVDEAMSAEDQAEADLHEVMGDTSVLDARGRATMGIEKPDASMGPSVADAITRDTPKVIAKKLTRIWQAADNIWDLVRPGTNGKSLLERMLIQADVLNEDLTFKEGAEPRQLSLHEILDRFLAEAVGNKDTDADYVITLVRHLRRVAPDLPVTFAQELTDPVDRTRRAARADSTRGWFHPATNEIQVKVDSAHSATMLVTLLHEAAHAASVYHIEQNPDSKEVRALEELRQEVLELAQLEYGKDAVDRSVAYFSGETKYKGQPIDKVDVRFDVYGLTNVKEFLSETLTNPVFQARLVELGRRGGHRRNILSRIADSLLDLLKKALGSSTPSDTWLLADAASKSMAVMARQALRAQTDTVKFNKVVDALEPLFNYDRQRATRVLLGKFHEDDDRFYSAGDLAEAIEGRKRRTGVGLGDVRLGTDRGATRRDGYYLGTVYGAGARNHALALGSGLHGPADLAPLYSMAGPPIEQELRREDVVRRVAGSVATGFARRTLGFMKTRAAESLRSGFLSTYTFDQLERRMSRYFGSQDDPTNPLRKVMDTRRRRMTAANKLLERAQEQVNAAWLQLSGAESKQLGQMMVSSTIWQIDPRKAKDDQLVKVKKRRGFDARWSKVKAEWEQLNPAQKEIYENAAKYNEYSFNQLRRAAVNLALNGYSDKDINPRERSLLYSLRDPDEVEDFVGFGKLVDLGENNEGFIKTLKDVMKVTGIEGPYFTLRRQGSLVVQADKDGEKVFATAAEAESFAERIKDMTPKNKAKVVERGGQHVVDYKIDYVSFHHSRREAEAEVQQLNDMGIITKPITKKQQAVQSSALTPALKELVSKAEKKLPGKAGDKGRDAIVAALENAFTVILAERAAIGSQLKRENVAGVKPEEMHLGFAERAHAFAWHYANLTTAKEEARTLHRLREYGRDPELGNVDQDTMYQRGEVVSEVERRLTQEAEDFGVSGPIDAAMAKLGFATYLTTPSYAFINAMQNFTVAIPAIGARFGYGRTSRAFARAMGAVVGPAFSKAFRGLASKPGRITSYDVYRAVADSVADNPKLKKWVEGDNSPIQQLVELGVINASFTQELVDVAHGESLGMQKILEWSRLVPQAAEMMNRISTALAVLELTNGNVTKTADMVRLTQIDYASQNRPRAFKAFDRVPGGRAILMFKMYPQAMYHLLASSVHDLFKRGEMSRAEAAKTLGSLVLSHSLAGGVLGGLLVEPLRLLMAAIQGVIGDDDEPWDIDTGMRVWAAETFGEWWGRVVSKGLPNALGVDLSNRIGLDHMFFWNLPDWKDRDSVLAFMGQQLGPVASFVASGVSRAATLWGRGEYFQAMAALVPVKLLRDAAEAAQYATDGLTSSGGTPILPAEEFNGWNLASQFLGFDPAKAADQHDKNTTRFGYQQWMKGRKAEILAELRNAESPAEKQAAFAAVRRFNERNPGARITAESIQQSRRTALRSAAEARGDRVKDQGLRERLAY